MTKSLCLKSAVDEAHATPRSCSLGSDAKVSDWELGSCTALIPAHVVWERFTLGEVV